jgi:phenylacetate-CoA ligase
VNKIFDPIAGRALSRLGDVALSSWGAYRALFAPVFSTKTRDWVARTRASAAFFNARRTVPAYQEFLREHGAFDVERFEDVPPMDKAGYIKRWPLEQVCQGGRLPLHGAVIDESSGSSGQASNWVRGPSERAAARRLLQFATRAAFGDEPFVLLNAFALGPWATGMNVSMSLVDLCVLKSIGPDAAKVIGTLALLGPKYKYVITGYPPFLKGLVDTAAIDWSAYDVCAVVGGEGMSQPLRAALNRRFRKTISSFGASDLEINIAVETDFTIALRDALASNASLADALYGREPLPMVFQYDPLNYYIESDADRNLLVTINRLENVSPRIRYNIRDRGVVLPAREVVTTAARLGVDLPAPLVDLPLLFHWGRQDNAVGFYGCKITPEDIQHVILRVGALGERVTNFALHPYEDTDANKRVEIWFELAADADLPDTERLREAVLTELAAVNQDFRESIKMVPADRRPAVKVFRQGQSPIPSQDVRLKRQYIL